MKLFLVLALVIAVSALATSQSNDTNLLLHPPSEALKNGTNSSQPFSISSYGPTLLIFNPPWRRLRPWRYRGIPRYFASGTPSNVSNNGDE
uniref:Putative secreted protein n=1 Tax=Aedes aegypti TaxID=7159 RepID=Q1I1B7_AEDAE|nr:putative secreted protein precursor [Aedes aegypti]